MKNKFFAIGLLTMISFLQIHCGFKELQVVDSSEKKLQDETIVSKWKTLNYFPLIDTETAIRGLWFSDSSTGVKLQSYIYKTEDGGVSWQPSFDEIYTNFKAISVLDKNRWFAVGEKRIEENRQSVYYPLIISTKDSGKTWQSIWLNNLPTKNKKLNSCLMGVDFVNNKSGWTISNKGEILTTGDGGISWKFKTHLIDERIFFGLVALKEKHIIAYGENGLLYETIDGGNKWNKLNSPVNEYIYKLKYKNGRIWLLTDGKVLVSDNNAKSWKTFLSATSIALYDLAITNKEVIVVGENSTIIKTDADGNSFRYEKTEVETDFHCVFTLSSKEIWIGGSGGTIIRNSK
jgi:photosystem II stability/assembly factor-like uncharacterized protein